MTKKDKHDARQFFASAAVHIHFTNQQLNEMLLNEEIVDCDELKHLSLQSLDLVNTLTEILKLFENDKRN